MIQLARLTISTLPAALVKLAGGPTAHGHPALGALRARVAAE